MLQIARRYRLPLVVILVLGGAAAGLGVAVVHATREKPQLIRPYDPHW